ncbi:hypothetical protein NMG60_11007246 [Bertholletia excelsa]
MAKNDSAKKRKLVKKGIQKIKVEKKKKKQPGKKKIDKATAVLKKQNQIETCVLNDSSDSYSSSEETEPEKIQKLLEPYTKDQLIEFIIDAAINDAALLSRIREAADCDVSHRKIFVHGLGWDTTQETLASAFESYGEIEECKVVTDRATGKAKGYGFVLFKTRRGATKALKQPRKMPGHNGRKIYVSNVQPGVDSEKLRAFFAKFGEIESGPLGFDMRTGKARGFALFVYKTLEGARKALQEPYKMFEGHQLHCKRAAEGKISVGGAASVTTAVQTLEPPVLEAAAAAQNLAFFSHHPSLMTPMYNGMFANPNAGFLTSGSYPIVAVGGLGQGVLGTGQAGQMSAAGGLGGYGITGSVGLGSLGGSPSGMQHAYPSSQIGLKSDNASAPGGSFSGYPSNMWYELGLKCTRQIMLVLSVSRYVGVQFDVYHDAKELCFCLALE